MPERKTGGSRINRARAPETRRVLSALRSTVRLQLLEAIETSPGVDARRLATAIGSSPPRLYYHLKILVSAGLVRECGGAVHGSPRGPSAARYESCRRVEPSELLGEDGVVGEQLSRLREHVLKKGRASGALEIASFHREALLPEEVERARGLLSELRQLLAAARARRRNGRSLERASVFVGMCLVRIREGTLPDLPLGS
jgi:DNA-binding transcriptional ArsR family regulator